MAKQLSWKDQMYQDLANSQVQQVIKEQRDQDYKMAQDLIAQYQPTEDDFAIAQNLISQYQPKTQQPVKQATVSEVKAKSAPVEQEKIPSIADFFKPMTASGKDVNKESANAINREAYARQQQKENELASKATKRSKEQIAKNIIENKTVDKFVPQANVQDQNNVNDYRKALLGNADTEKAKKTETVLGEKRATKEDAIQKQLSAIPESAIVQYAQTKGISVDEARAEVEEGIRKANAVNTSIAPTNGAKLDQEATEKAQAIAAEQKRKASQKRQNVYEAALNNAGDAITGVVNGPIRLAGMAAGKDWDLVGDVRRERVEQANEQHPVASGVGRLAGMAAAAYYLGGGSKGTQAGAAGTTAGDALTTGYESALVNGATKSQAMLEGAINAGRQIAANTAKAMPVDLLTDIIPTLANDIASDKSIPEIIKNTTINTLINGGMDSIGDVVSMIKPFKAIGSSVNKSSLDELIEMTQNLPGNEADDIAKQLPGMNTAAKNSNIVNLDAIPVEQRASTLALIKQKAHNAFNDFKSGVANSDIYKKHIKLMQVPEKLANMLDQASAGKKNISGKNISFDLDKLNHLIKSHGNKGNEALRNQIAYDDGIIDTLIDAFYSPDMVENVSNGLAGMQKETFAIGKKDQGLIIIMNSISDGKSQSIIPEEIIHVDPSRMQDVLDNKKSMADVIYENFKKPRVGDINGNIEDIKNRVTAAADTSISANPARTSETASAFSPSDSNITDAIENVNKNTINNSVENPNKVMAEEANFLDDFKNEDGTFKIEEEYEPPKQSRAETMMEEGAGDVPPTNEKVSQFYTNSMHRNEGNWDVDDLSSEAYSPEQFKYVPTTEKQSLNNAIENVKANRDSLIDRYTNQADKVKTSKEAKGFYSSQDVDQMHLLIRDLRSKERAATDEAVRQLFAQQREEITRHLYDATHSSAAVMQAGQKWLNDIDGILDTADSIRLKKMSEMAADNPNLQKEINNVANDIYERLRDLEKNNLLADMSVEARRAKVRELVEDAISNSNVKRRLGKADIDKLVDQVISGSRSADNIMKSIDDVINTVGAIKPETVDKVYDIWANIENLDPGSKQFHNEVKKIYSLLANDIGGSGTFSDKVNAWRYFSMLSNPTTHIRNLLGNVTMNWMTGIKNDIAAGIEAAADFAARKNGGIQGGRTKSFLTFKDSDLVKQSGKYFDDHAFSEFAEGGNRYLSASKGIEDELPVFKTKVLDKGVKGHTNLLSAEDTMFGKAKYQTSLAGFLKANGADASIFNAKDPASRELLERANKYALEQANAATFHTENEFANGLSRLTKEWRNSSNPLTKSLGFMVDTTIPFKKTPANILKNCFEYSPAEFAKVIVDIGKWRKGTISTAKMIDNLSKAVTGTAGMTIGAILAHEGIIHVTGSDTDREKRYDTQEGKQGIALSVFGHDIDLSFLPPSIMPFILGATLLKDYQEKYGDDYTALDVLTSSLTDPELLMDVGSQSLDTIVDTTMLSGISDLISTIRYAESKSDAVKSLAAKTATNFAGQMIPTLVKKTASVLDGQKYSSYSDKKGPAKIIDQSAKYLKTTIPGLQQLGAKMEQSKNEKIASLGDMITAEEKINGWGQSMKKEDYGLGIAGRAIDQYLNPATTTSDKSDETTRAIRELADQLNDDSVLKIGQIDTSESNFTVDDKPYKLNEKEFTQYSKIKGQLAKEMADYYIASDNWASDTNENKATVIDQMNNFAKAYAQNEVANKPMSTANANLKAIYEKEGTEGLVNSLIGKAAAKSIGLDSDSNAAKAIQKAAEEGNTDAAYEMTEQVDLLPKYGLDSAAAKGAYTKAYDVYGEGYSAEEFSKTFKAIDRDHNQALKKDDEIIPYMNSQNMNYSDGMTFWKAFAKTEGSNPWKVPTLKNGVWK